MLEMAPSGIEQVDDGDTVEFAVYGAPGELPELEPGEAEVAGVRVQVSGTPVPDDWEERWKAFHRPVLVADRIYVRPPWEEPVGADVDLEIDPGRAFGTGSHSTTRLCLALLAEVEPAAGSVVDLGCGSGVLAIAAARLGFGPVTALDADRLAVEATAQNAAANGVELERVARANLREEPAPAADLVLANLMRPLLLRVAELIDRPAGHADRLGPAGPRGRRGGGGVRAAGRGQALQRQGLDRPAAQTPDWLTTPVTSCHHARSSAVSLRCTRSRQ